MNVIVTGGNGFVGSEIVRHCLLDGGGRVTALVRDGAGDTATGRMDRVFRKWGMFAPVPVEAMSRLRVVSWESPGEDWPDVFIHAAASTAFDSSIEVARRDNVETTRKAIELAKRLGAKRFVHVSTAFVAGRRRGRVLERDAVDPNRDKFNNAYERSKAESEALVRACGMSYVIVRPSVIVGDSRTGYTPHFRVIYTVLRLWASGRIPRAPVDFSARVDMVPIDYVVRATLALACDPGAVNGTFHLTLGDRHVRAGDFFEAAIRMLGLPKPRFIHHWIARFLVRPGLSRWLPYELASAVEAARWHLPYIWRRGQVFDTSGADRLLGPREIVCPAFEEFETPLFRFCRESAWGKRRVGSVESV